MHMLAELQPYAFHPFHQLHDWLFMGAIVVAFAIPEVVASIRRRQWRRQVLSAFR
jgi:hypothetical protein